MNCSLEDRKTNSNVYCSGGTFWKTVFSNVTCEQVVYFGVKQAKSPVPSNEIRLDFLLIIDAEWNVGSWMHLQAQDVKWNAIMSALSSDLTCWSIYCPSGLALVTRRLGMGNRVCFALRPHRFAASWPLGSAAAMLFAWEAAVVGCHFEMWSLACSDAPLIRANRSTLTCSSPQDIFVTFCLTWQLAF